MTTRGYPVIEERQLDRPKRGWLGSRREIAELPAQQPGTVLVFEVDGRFEALSDRRHLSGKEEIVVGAVAVCVVDMRERLVPVDVQLPSRSPANEFLIRATFRCRVTQPDAVAAAGISDLTHLLHGHLSQDPTLAALCSMHLIDEITEVRQQATARVTAFCRVQPPRVAGMSISFREVYVLTPDDLRTHATGVRDEIWRKDLETQRRAADDEEVRYVKGILDEGPESLAALAISRSQLHLGEATDREYELRAQRQRERLEMAKILAERGHFDTMPVDPTRFIEGMFDQPAGELRGGSTAAPLDAGRSGPAGQQRADQDTPDILGEDELLG
jgi:hypothetical protein